MPKGFINCAFIIKALRFFLMPERTPPVFHDFHQISVPFKQRHTVRTIPGAVKHPKQFRLRRADGKGRIHGNLAFQLVTVRGAIGGKILPGLQVLSTNHPQVIIGQIST